MILVFDLDDTLYDEITYVHSGFRTVSRYTEVRWGLNARHCYQLLLKTLDAEGRGKVFDTVLRHYGIATKTSVRECVSVYRSHQPVIQLYKSADKCLNRYRRSRKYLVTDGNKLVQSKKVQALGIASEFRRVMITHRYGLSRAKPSPYCFEKIVRIEQVKPEGVVYIGDNPAKDFVGIKPLGFKTIRVLTGAHKDIFRESQYEAHKTVRSLDEITPEVINQL